MIQMALKTKQNINKLRVPAFRTAFDYHLHPKICMSCVEVISIKVCDYSNALTAFRQLQLEHLYYRCWKAPLRRMRGCLLESKVSRQPLASKASKEMSTYKRFCIKAQNKTLHGNRHLGFKSLCVSA